jgi:DNA-3-methyladenine glycosylase
MGATAGTRRAPVKSSERRSPFERRVGIAARALANSSLRRQHERPMARLSRSFFARPALVVARELLGKVLVHRTAGHERSGIIVETEAYLGERDLASHASRGRTARTEVMFGPPGHAYVYFVYGMHHCMNVVTGEDGTAEAVLLRALAPLHGIEADQRTDGPGKLCRVLGIDRAHNRSDLVRGDLFFRDGPPPPRGKVARGPRIGVDYAGAWSRKPYRFWWRGHSCVSRKRR